MGVQPQPRARGGLVALRWTTRLRTNQEFLSRLPLEPARAAGRERRDIQPEHPRTEGAHLRRLSWWRRQQRRYREGNEPRCRLEGQDRAQADSRALRFLPLRRRTDEEIQPRAACRSVPAVQD